jgi:hypothetical protein
MTRPAPINAMRFSLRTLLIVMLVVPPLTVAAWDGWRFILTHICTIQQVDP